MPDTENGSQGIQEGGVDCGEEGNGEKELTKLQSGS